MLTPDYNIFSFITSSLLCYSIPVLSTNSNPSLGTYLAGLIEGDGSIIVPSS